MPQLGKSKEAKTAWIAKKIEELIKKNPDMRVLVLRFLLQEWFRIKVDEFRLYKAKQQALRVLLEEHGECTKIIRTYANMILLTNPGLRVIICTREPSMTFDKMFACFNAQ